MDFAYSDLASNELRLLSPVLGANDGDLCFTVSHVPRDKAPPYTAISYTWGDGKPTEVIYLNGRAFQIRLNLWSCLHYLSPYSREGFWNHIWVDAICINQANNLERNAQVRLMDKTYINARCVSVWLGLVPFPTRYQYQTFGLEPTRTLDHKGFNWEDSIDDLANRPYWSRVWVIQEVLLGRSVQLFCSRYWLDWDDFQKLLLLQPDINPWIDVYDDDIRPAKTDSYSALPVLMGRHSNKHPEFLQPLYDLLVRYRRSKCEDSRDRVFALLGLIPSDDRVTLSRFFPDYTLSEDDVVIITLAHLMQVNHKKVVPENEELFLGLGVELQERRRRLLRRATDFDYLAEMAPSIFHKMIWRDELECAETLI